MSNDPWERWSGLYNDRGVMAFVRDGGGHDYEREPRRLLFVLKEPHGTQWTDAREQLSSPPRGMWHALARWAYGIVKGFPDYSTIGHQQRRWALSRIAIINLKKEGGGKNADRDVISAFAHRDRDILREQIEALAPTMVVACGADVFTPLVWLLDVRLPDPRAPLRHGVRIPNSADHAWLLPWRHPAHGGGKKYYGALQEMVNSLAPS